MGAVLLLWRVGATALPFQEIPASYTTHRTVLSQEIAVGLSAGD